MTHSSIWTTSITLKKVSMQKKRKDPNLTGLPWGSGGGRNHQL